jgi:hypothetical protein
MVSMLRRPQSTVRQTAEAMNNMITTLRIAFTDAETAYGLFSSFPPDLPYVGRCARSVMGRPR